MKLRWLESADEIKRASSSFHIGSRYCLRAGSAALLVLLLAARPLASQTPSARVQPSIPPLELLQRAHTLFAEGDYTSAQKYYLQVLPSFPNNFDILRDLAYCYFTTGPHGYAQAAVYYARAYQINPQSSEVAEKLNYCYMALKQYRQAAAVDLKMAQTPGAPAETWKNLAEAYEQAGEMENASSAYLAYLQRNPGDLLARSNLGRIYSWQKDYSDAIAQYQIVLSSNPNFSQALVGMAQLLSWQGQLARSLEFYDRVLRFEPHNGEAESGKAFVLLWQGQDDEALALFKQLHRRFPHDTEVSRGMAEAQTAAEQKAFVAAEKSGDTSKIIAYYRERLATNPKDVDALRALMVFNANNTHCRESIVFGRQALQFSKGEPEVELELARSLTLCQDYSEAIQRYQDYLRSNPKAEGALYELGDTLLRAQQAPEAINVFHQLLQTDPRNLDGQVGLAQALAATGQYDQAMTEFNEALRQAPDNYDALQGKGYILYYRNDFEQARAIFQSLEQRNPGDSQNAQALLVISAAEEQARWAALRPAPDAPPQAWRKFYEERLASYPSDRDAMKGLAYIDGELNNLPAAIEGYRRVLALYPGDRESQMELARLLALDRQYPASIDLYRQVLQSDPDDPNVLEKLAQVEDWAGQYHEALEIYQRLLASQPSNTGYMLEVGSLEARLKEYPAAKNTLGALLTQEPGNDIARLETAQLDLDQGYLQNSLQNFEILLKHNPQNLAALTGKADIDYRQGRLAEAEAGAAKAISSQPKDFTALFLMASIQNAHRHRRQALDLLDRADKVSPGNPDVAALRSEILAEPGVTVHTSASFAREIGPPSQSGSRTNLPNEDLRMYSYGTTVGFFLIPRTHSYLSLTAMPNDSPPGPVRNAAGAQLPTGITGAAGPAMFLYRQDTQLTSRLVLRAGAGGVRFGPGGYVPVQGQPAPIQSAQDRVLWLAGLSYSMTPKIRWDFTGDRTPIAYTPVATKLGVVDDELKTGVIWSFNALTDMHVIYAYGYYSTQSYNHTSTAGGPVSTGRFRDTDSSNFGSIDFMRNFYRSERISVEGGYEGVIFGFAHPLQHPFLGFYDPDFYQRHELTPRFYGQLWGPIGYDINAGIGIQQSGSGSAIKRALNVNPKFTWRVSRHLVLTLGYTYYNTAQALGPLRGNAVSAATDWTY